MKRSYIFLSLLTVFLFSIPYFSYASAISPYFGGQVVVTFPCNSGLLVYLLTSSGVENLLWTDGELPFLSFVPPHIGQYMVGMSAMVMAPCTLGPYTIGQGYPIIYHGESL